MTLCHSIKFETFWKAESERRVMELLYSAALVFSGLLARLGSLWQKALILLMKCTSGTPQFMPRACLKGLDQRCY